LIMPPTNRQENISGNNVTMVKSIMSIFQSFRKIHSQSVFP
jgi:hypothetical protein